MKRLTTLALVSLVALLATGLAIAHNKISNKTEAVAASFSATPTSDTKSEPCTGADGTYTLTRGVYEGTSTGDARLTGKLTLKTKSAVNTTTGLGWSKGSFKILGADEKKIASGHLTAVVTQTGVLNGMLHGKVQDGGPLLANFTATVASNGALAGSFGSGAGDNSAVLVGGCSKSDDDHKKNDDHKKSDGDKKDARRK